MRTILAVACSVGMLQAAAADMIIRPGLKLSHAAKRELVALAETHAAEGAKLLRVAASAPYREAPAEAVVSFGPYAAVGLAYRVDYVQCTRKKGKRWVCATAHTARLLHLRPVAVSEDIPDRIALALIHFALENGAPDSSFPESIRGAPTLYRDGDEYVYDEAGKESWLSYSAGEVKLLRVTYPIE